jgi:hypothetical protein
MVDAPNGDPRHPQQPGLADGDGEVRLAEGFTVGVAPSQDPEPLPRHAHPQVAIGFHVPPAVGPAGC